MPGTLTESPLGSPNFLLSLYGTKYSCPDKEVVKEQTYHTALVWKANRDETSSEEKFFKAFAKKLFQIFLSFSMSLLTLNERKIGVPSLWVIQPVSHGPKRTRASVHIFP